MNCEKYNDLLPLYASGDIDERQKLELDAHLRKCENCRRAVGELREIIDAFEGVNADNLTEIEKLRLENRIYRDLARRSTRHAVSGLTRNLIRVAAVLVVFLFGYGSRMLLSGPREHSPATSNIAASPTVSIDYSRVMASRFRFSSEGLKVIAKGKAALPPEMKQEPQAAPAAKLN